LTGIHNPMKCLFLVNRICIHKGPYLSPHVKNLEDSILTTFESM
jgi:hypothetical protein